MKYFFRVDANQIVGTGHLKRCLVLAKRLAKYNAEIQFICTQNTVNFCSELGFPINVIPDNLDQSLDALESQKFLSSDSNLIVDSYILGLEWENNFKSLIVIDDIEREHSADYVIDQNFRADYSSLYQNSNINQTRLLGTKYCLLDELFLEARSTVSNYQDRSEKLFVCYGGGDNNRYLKNFFSVFSKINWPIIIAAGSSELKSEAEKHGIEFHSNSKIIAKLMSQAQLAVGAGGTMNWERLCLGLPSVVQPIADNQMKICNDLSSAGYISLALKPESLLPQIKKLISDPDSRIEMSSKGMELVDAKGAKRVASILISKQLSLRPASEDDCKNIFEWRNHELNRKYSLNSALLDWQIHQKWFAKALNESKILVVKSLASEIAVVRFDFGQIKPEISIYMAPGFHGLGYGLSVLLAATNWFESNYPKTHLNAKILPSNQASISIFTEAGFKFLNSSGDKSEHLFTKSN
jgi:UDP-2,4-diacetamido-2,4,6-trideoxy-beta-L-altropyranose hydrolase